MGMLTDVFLIKMSGLDRFTKATSVVSQKMADLVVVSMADIQGKCFWVLHWLVLDHVSYNSSPLLSPH